MKSASRFAAILAIFGGGALAAFSIRESAASDYTLATEEGMAGVLVTPQWAGTVAAVVAIVMLTALMSLRSRALTVAALLAGAIAIGLPDVVSVATETAVTVNAVGAGLLLAAVAYPAVGRRGRMIALATGVLAATMFFGVTGAWRIFADRWAVALAGDPFSVPATVPLPVLAAAVIVLGAVAIGTPPADSHVNARSVIVGVVLPVTFLVLYTLLGSTDSGAVSWTVAVGLAVAATFGAAWWLPSPSGLVLLLGTALAAVTIGQIHYVVGAEWWLLGALPLLAGLVLGLRYPTASMWSGMVLLVAVTASVLLPVGGTFDSITAAAYAFVLPGAVGLCVASVLSTTPLNPPVVLIAAVLPLTMTFFAVSAPRGPVDMGWSSLPVSDSGLTITAIAPLPIGIVSAIVTVVLAALAEGRQRWKIHPRTHTGE